MTDCKMIVWFVLSCCVCWLAAESVLAQDARTHFDEGVHAFDEQRFGDAATEFERAYELKPDWRVLYNLGTVYAALGRPVEAVDAFERYLGQADDSLAAQRREQVQTELDTQRSKIGWLTLRVAPSGAEIRVDARHLGMAPLAAAVPTSAGRHSVDVSFQGLTGQRRDVTVVAGETLPIEFNLQPDPPASLSMAPAQPRVADNPGSAQRVLGWCMGGLGLVASLTGGAIAIKGQLDHASAVDDATQAQAITERATALESRANQEKLIGFVTLGAGASVLIAGLIVLWTAPSGRPTHAATEVSGWASSSSGGVVLRRQW